MERMRWRVWGGRAIPITPCPRGAGRRSGTSWGWDECRWALSGGRVQGTTLWAVSVQTTCLQVHRSATCCLLCDWWSAGGECNWKRRCGGGAPWGLLGTWQTKVRRAAPPRFIGRGCAAIVQGTTGARGQDCACSAFQAGRHGASRKYKGSGRVCDPGDRPQHCAATGMREAAGNTAAPSPMQERRGYGTGARCM